MFTAATSALSQQASDTMRGVRGTSEEISAVLNSAKEASKKWRADIHAFVETMSTILRVSDLPMEPWIKNSFRPNITLSGNDKRPAGLIDLSSSSQSIDED
jgi:hypothetical protein